MTAFPHVIGGVGDLADYISANKAAIDDALTASGAVLFRGFDVPDPLAFDAAVVAYREESFTYEESLSNAVRVNVTERVFTANEAPPETEIFMHHEMAQTPLYPSKLMFYCEIAPGEGGATPLCRSDVLFDELQKRDPDNAAAFKERGVRYSNTMPGENDAGSGQGRSWRSTLGVETREDAEARLLALGYEWEWTADDSLRATTPILPAVRELGDGRTAFFNQLIAAFCGWSDTRNDGSRAITFGDGEPITQAHMAAAIALSEELVYDHAWQSGDVVLVDNFAVMHGRRPFTGKRRVLASLIS
ncbi:TauD/TfdA family dioxygenase [Altererythrobacter lutimaris]|uniref:TauD/TfdA family dioxygenase n=1 Tax=Altererythrobacter lutimaris TaxID=2743979 RepID=A0A850HEC3_9SPHN|nr:TauD/TfdA family dioxygenase [Altererythrobacter lutimaris]NVE96040.1 TauD/TfdA family dioxygenase [Altererythrobacter lutimaris]